MTASSVGTFIIAVYQKRLFTTIALTDSPEARWSLRCYRV